MNILINFSCYRSGEDAIVGSKIIKNQINNDSIKVHTLLTLSDHTYILEKNNTFDYVEKNDYINYSYLSKNITGRAFSSIITGIKFGSSRGFDYMIHLNSGSLILDFSKISNLIQKYNNIDILFQYGCRGKFIMIDDHFLIINLNKFVISDILIKQAFNSINCKYNEIHGILSYLISQVGITSYPYHNHSTSISEFYRMSPNGFAPISFNREYLLLHTNKNKGENIKYLREAYIDFYINKKLVYNKKHVIFIDNCFYIKNKILDNIKILLNNIAIAFIHFSKKIKFNSNRFY